jgi:hypothetical protein
MVRTAPTAAASLLSSPRVFSAGGPRPLRPYQADCAQAIATSVARHQGKIFTVMFGRQMGKNETSALLEAYLLALFSGKGGSIVKAAPSFKPQIVNSILRLKETLDSSPLTRNRWQPQFGYMMRLGRATCAFLSADEHANVVGATASLLLEIDEAQDVDPDKYDRDFRPMASSTNATTVLYGTAWSQDSLLELRRQRNLEHQSRTGEQLHFEYDWTALARINPHYDAFVRGEIARLGSDHPVIQTQYLLHTLADAGRLFTAEHRRLLAGSHPHQAQPIAGEIYVAGIDVAGEAEQEEDAAVRLASPKRDSTVVTIARLTRTDDGQPRAEVVEQVWWTGRDQVWQYQQILALWERWHFARAAVDSSGIGYGLAQFLEARQPERTEPVTFSQPAKSQLGYELLASINTGRLCTYTDDGSPQSREFWKEVSATRYELRTGEVIRWFVPESDGHDDFVVSLALCNHAAQLAAPPAHSAVIRGQGYDTGETW